MNALMMKYTKSINRNFSFSHLFLFLILVINAPLLLSEPVELAGRLEAISVADQKSGEHRVWVHDWNGGLYSRAMLFNSDDGDMLGSVETGWEGVKLDISSAGDRIYNLGLYMSRGYHGKRTDVLEYYDRSSLQVLGEIAVPAKAPRGLPNTNHSDFSDDEHFLFVSFFTPASSVGIIDLRSDKYVGEIETAGCAYVMAGGDRRFYTICGDGSLLSITIDDSGKELSRTRLRDVFDAINDPLHGTGVRSDDLWYFVTHLGELHTIDVSGAEIEHKVLWSTGEKSSESTAWVPAEMFQHIAVHKGKQQLFVLLGDQDLLPKGGGPDYHRKQGTEVWVYDLQSQTRIKRIELPGPMNNIAVSQDANPALYASSLWTPKVYVYSALTGKLQSNFETTYASMNTLLQPVEPR